MSYPRLVGVIANTDKYERRNCTQSTLGSIAFLRTLSDSDLLLVAREEEPYAPISDVFKNVRDAVSPSGSINPTWLTSTSAAIAYDRGLIWEDELDRLMA